jgi:hypothetical protein
MRAAAVTILILGALVARPAGAFEDFEGTRALGMGGATRAWALADSAILLNPAGMPLAKSYNVEAAYAYGSRLSDQFLHASIVDSTSAINLAGGVYYTYHRDDPAGVSGRGHEVGVALAMPIGPMLSLGATGKWFHLQGADAGATAVPLPAMSEAATPTSTGLTFDVGANLRPVPVLSFAVVGVNLVDRHQAQAPQMLTYGAAYIPVTELVVTLDGVTTFTRDAYTGLRGTGVRGGLEATLAQRVALRAGGGTDAALGTGYLAAGLSVLSEVGAIDVGARGDLFPYATGASRNVFVGVSLRLFVPGAIASAQPPP